MRIGPGDPSASGRGARSRPDPRTAKATTSRTGTAKAKAKGTRRPDPVRAAASAPSSKDTARARIAQAKAGIRPTIGPPGSRTVRVSSNPRGKSPASPSAKGATTRRPRPADRTRSTDRPPATRSRASSARPARRRVEREPVSSPAGRAVTLGLGAYHGIAHYFARTSPGGRGLEAVHPKVTRARTGRRLVLTLVVLTLLFTLIIYKLADLQVLNSGSYTAFGESQRVRTETLAADRGAILDRNGTPLALSTPQKSVFVDPQVIENAPEEARLLADALGLDAADVEQKMTAANRFGYVARQIPEEQAAKVRALKTSKDPNDPKAKVVDRLRGVEFIDEPKRFVPSGELAKSIIGQVDIDGQGISGLEKMYGDELTGTPGKLVLERNPDGRTIAPAEPVVIPAVKGHDVQLTLDRSLQFETERIIAEQVRAAGAKGGIAVVMKPDSGEVLSMANVVADPETGEVSVDGNNAALTTVYEPGSVMKMIPASGALENGKVQPDTVVGLTDTLQICDSEFSEHDYHGNVGWKVSEIIAQSSNIGTIKLGQMIGKDEIYRYMRAFGIGQRSAIDFPNEQAGTLAEPKDWWCSSSGSIPIGQGVSVTPLQMLVAYNTIANGGVYVAPKLVQATIDGDGSRHPTPTDPGHRVVSQKTADQMNVMLRSVVETGTGTAAAIAGYQPAGKTGTARKPEPGGGYIGADGAMHYQATFVGFVPAEAPALSIIVIIDDPSTGGIFGGVQAAPAFAKIGETALRQFAIPPPAIDLAAGGRPADNSKHDPAKIATTTTISPDGTTGPVVQRTPDGRVRGPAAGDETTTTTVLGSTSTTARTGSVPTQPVPTTTPRVTSTTSSTRPTTTVRKTP